MDRHVLSAGRAMCAAAACALAVLALATPVHGQAVRGTLLGSIGDTSGSSVPGATVTATDQGTSISSTTVTNQDGFYTFPNLKDGIYRVEAELTGFKKVVRENVRVDVNTTIRVDLDARSRRHHRGADGQRRSAAAAVGSHRHRPHHPGRADRRDAARLRPQLPGHGRHGARRVAAVQAALRVLQLAGFAVVQRQRPVAPRQQRPDRGRRQQSPHRPADGVDSVGRGARDRQRRDQQLRRRVRPRRRRRHQRHAEVGHQPVQGQRVLLRQHRRRPSPPTRSSIARCPRSARRRETAYHQGGFTLGGPIIRNRLFFFGDYIRTSDDLGRINRYTIPTEAMRNGDFSASSVPIFDPLTGDPATGAGRTQFPGNRIPAEPHQPDRAPHPGQRAAAEHRRRRARPDQLPGRDRPRAPHRRLRREVQLPAVAEGSDVGPLQLPAADRVRARQLRRRRVRRALPGRLRRHRRQHDAERGRQLDAHADQHVRDGRALRRQHVSQRGAQRRQRADHGGRRRHSRRQPRRRTPAA